jgi:hypothetical protein
MACIQVKLSPSRPIALDLRALGSSLGAIGRESRIGLIGLQPLDGRPTAASKVNVEIADFDLSANRCGL